MVAIRRLHRSTSIYKSQGERKRLRSTPAAVILNRASRSTHRQRSWPYEFAYYGEIKGRTYVVINHSNYQAYLSVQYYVKDVHPSTVIVSYGSLDLVSWSIHRSPIIFPYPFSCRAMRDLTLEIVSVVSIR